MATSKTIQLTENVYSGGTVVFAEGTEITEDQAHTYGVAKNGSVDRTLSTDELRERLSSVAGPVAAEDLPSDIKGAKRS